MILFIDDEMRYIRSFVDEITEQLGGQQEIEVIDNVDDALAKIQDRDFANRIDLIVLDVMMPGRNSFDSSESSDGLRTGLKLFERLRHLKRRVLVFTNVGDPEVKRWFEDNGCLYIRKPDVLPHEFTEKVVELLAGRDS